MISKDPQWDDPVIGQIVNLIDTAGLGDEQDIEELLQVSGDFQEEIHLEPKNFLTSIVILT